MRGGQWMPLDSTQANHRLGQSNPPAAPKCNMLNVKCKMHLQKCEISELQRRGSAGVKLITEKAGNSLELTARITGILEYDVPFLYCCWIRVELGYPVFSHRLRKWSLVLVSLMQWWRLRRYLLIRRGNTRKENTFDPHTSEGETQRKINNTDGSGPLSIEVLLIYWRCPIVVKSLYTLFTHFAAAANLWPRRSWLAGWLAGGLGPFCGTQRPANIIMDN